MVASKLIAPLVVAGVIAVLIASHMATSATNHERGCMHVESRIILSHAEVGAQLDTYLTILKDRHDYFLIHDVAAEVSKRSINPTTEKKIGIFKPQEIVVVSSEKTGQLLIEKELLFLDFDSKNRLAAWHCELAYTGL
jgi:hypothetical protein